MATIKTVFGQTIKYDRRVTRHIADGRPSGANVTGVPTYGSHDPKLIVLHDTESADYAGIRDILGIADYFRNTHYPSTHQSNGYYTLGCHDIVDEEGHIGHIASGARITYHDGVNTNHIGIEQIGFARFSLRTWNSRQIQLRSVAKLLAWYGHRYDIPMKVDPSCQSGVATHAMVSAAFPGSTDHTDPGRGYPLVKVVDMAHRMVGQGYWYVYYLDGKKVW